jgi:hypothetical protein
MSGPAPKPPAKRRRYNKPASYGAAEPVSAPAADIRERTLDIENPHPLVAQLWTTLQESVESRFYSESDWERARFECWYANEVMRGQLSAAAWQQVQHGLSELLISPAAKRRAAIELKAAGPDADENAAVALLGRYRQQLKPL